MTERKHISRFVTWLAALMLPLAVLAQGQAPGAADETAGNESAGAQQQPSLPELQKQVQEAFQAEDYDTAVRKLQRMRAQLPFNGKLLYELAAAYALKGDPQRTFNTLVMLQQQGLAYSPRDDERFQSVKQYQLFDHISKLLEENNAPFDHAAVNVELETELKWPQAIARDGADGDFFIGGVGQGMILRVTPGGETSVFHAGEGDDKGPAGISALAVDAGRGHLWAAGTAVRGDGQGLSINMQAAALYRYDLASGELQARLPIGDDKPLPHLFNEIALGPEGRVFAADALSPLVYEAAPGDDVLEAFVGAPGLSGFHGITATPDGKYLFVSDWVTGIYRITIADRKVHRLTFDPTVNLGGIHSLSYRDGELFAVQTGTRPARVARIQLDEALESAVAMFPLSANQKQYDRPGLGVLAGDGYYFVANSGWTLAGSPSAEAVAPVVLKADPDLARDRPTPAEMRKRNKKQQPDMMPQFPVSPGQTPPGPLPEEEGDG